MKIFEGGEGSGNFGHVGRPGQVGGSASQYTSLTTGEYLELSEKYSFEKKYGTESLEGFFKLSDIGFYLGAKYTYVNSVLRKGNLTGEPLKAGYTNAVEAVDDLISIGVAEKNLLVYRGTETAWDLKVGQEFEDKAFVSTSVSLKISSNFKDTLHQVFEIRVKEGTHVGYVGPTTHMEEEIILPRNSKFRVTKITNRTPENSDFFDGLSKYNKIEQYVELELL